MASFKGGHPLSASFCLVVIPMAPRKRKRPPSDPTVSTYSWFDIDDILLAKAKIENNPKDKYGQAEIPKEFRSRDPSPSSPSRASERASKASEDLTKLFWHVSQNTRTFLILGSPEVIRRPWCLGEMVTARVSEASPTSLRPMEPGFSFFFSSSSSSPVEAKQKRGSFQRKSWPTRWVFPAKKSALLRN